MILLMPAGDDDRVDLVARALAAHDAELPRYYGALSVRRFNYAKPYDPTRARGRTHERARAGHMGSSVLACVFSRRRTTGSPLSLAYSRPYAKRDARNRTFELSRELVSKASSVALATCAVWCAIQTAAGGERKVDGVHDGRGWAQPRQPAPLKGVRWCCTQKHSYEVDIA
jgi:hypothetical protein